ncbi:MAG TPA: hypothetical protein VJ476_15545 [Rhizomicrobium sp.]|nr:hypothetical protein [Rhizomicrobium sp.]
MARHQGPILVDTNVIIECWRTSSWKAFVGAYRVETVQMCEIETQTGAQNRRPEDRIDPQVLRSTLKAVHAVSDAEKARAIIADDQVRFLDPGELMLWAHALTRTDAWILCGPDKASLRIGIRLGFKDRLVSLERLLTDVGSKAKIALRANYTQKWLEMALAQLDQLEGKRP